MSGSEKPSQPQQASQIEDQEKVFLLEDVFKNPASLLSSNQTGLATSSDVLIVFDTNVLLLPYNIQKQDLPEIAAAFQKISDQKRVFVPARVIREFISQRERRFGEMISALTKARTKNHAEPLPSVLAHTPSFAEIEEKHSALKKAKDEYVKSLATMIEEIRSWRGDDPVSQIYSQTFAPDRIVNHGGDVSAHLLNEWRRRVRLKIPPGFKDARKDDEGIGDYLIWLSILEIGRAKSKHLIFVTQDGKGDWSIRTENEPVYPRPELISEYKDASQGKNFRMCSMSEFLKEMDVSKNVVDDIAEAENTIPDQSSSLLPGSLEPPLTVFPDGFLGGGEISHMNFDRIEFITVGSGIASFTLRLSKGSANHLYLYTSGTNLTGIRYVGDLRPSTRVYTQSISLITGAEAVPLQGIFIAQNSNDVLMVGKVTSLSFGEDDSSNTVTISFYLYRGDAKFVVTPS